MVQTPNTTAWRGYFQPSANTSTPGKELYNQNFVEVGFL